MATALREHQRSAVNLLTLSLNLRGSQVSHCNRNVALSFSMLECVKSLGYPLKKLFFPEHGETCAAELLIICRTEKKGNDIPACFILFV